MRRILIAAGVVVLVAAGIVGYVVYRQMGASLTFQAVKPETSAAQVRVPAVVTAKVPAASGISAASAAVAKGRFDAKAVLGQLNPQEKKALAAAQYTQSLGQAMKAGHDQLPIQTKIMVLESLDNGRLKLSAAQQAQFKTVLEKIQPQMDAALKDSWSQHDQLTGQIGQLLQKMATDPDAAANASQYKQQLEDAGKELEDLQNTIQAQMTPFDQQVMAAMAANLTAEQAAMLKNMQVQSVSTDVQFDSNEEGGPARPLGTTTKVETFNFGGGGGEKIQNSK